MVLWKKLILLGLSLVGVGLGLAIWFASIRWNQKTSEFIEQIFYSHTGNSQKTVNFKDLEELPSPVIKYFRWALKEGQPMIRSVHITQEGRYREVNGEYELTPWAGHFRNYEERDGMQIPLEAEVEWQLPEGNFPYFRGRIVAVKYDFVE